jgi:hypothetical protein
LASVLDQLLIIEATMLLAIQIAAVTLHKTVTIAARPIATMSQSVDRGWHFRCFRIFIRRDLKMHLLRTIFAFVFVSFFAIAALAQSEGLTNADVVQLVKAGLGKELIVNKIKNSACSFDTSVTGLIELKKAGVDDLVVGVMLDRARESAPAAASASNRPGETIPITASNTLVASRKALVSARTIAFSKTSINPSIQALEKELLKRPDWRSLNIAVTEYKQTADLYVEIGFVHGSVVTHRYVYRIYDRRTGTVIAAGETTSWGSLAQNLARNISKSLTGVVGG